MREGGYRDFSRHVRRKALLLVLALSLLLSTLPPPAYPQETPRQVGPQQLPPELLEKIPDEAKDILRDRPELLEKAPEKMRRERERELLLPQPPEEEERFFVKPEEEVYRWQDSTYLRNLFLPRLRPDEIEALVHFGHDIFARKEGKFAPLSTLPVSPDYVVGPGDEILITMWGRIEGHFPATVDREGKIYVPKFGILSVAGKTYRELKDYIQERVSVVTGANVDVTMTSLKGIRVFILGEVDSPGAYNVSSLETAVSALYRAGSVKDTGSLRAIAVIRNGKTIMTIDLYRLLLTGNAKGDIRLLQGDTVFVPTVSNLVAVSGEVKRQGIYELTKKEGLTDLIKMAGGFSPKAYKRKVLIERLESNMAKIVLDVNAESLAATKENFPLKDGDIIRVSPLFYEDVNTVYLEGNVVNPGKYEFKQGMRLRDILPDEMAFLPDTYFEYATVTRLVPPDMHKEIIPVNLGKAVLEHDDAENIMLKPRDRVDVFFRQAFEDVKKASISGEVRKPGTYEIKESMRVSDIIKLGGGLAKTAYLGKGEVVRFQEDRSKITLYFDVGRALENDPENDILLAAEDWVIIHSVYETRTEEKVSILGAVKYPGEYPLTEGMTLSGLIFKGGGLLESAYDKEAEIIRYNTVEGEEVRTQTITIYPDRALVKEATADIRLQHQDRVIIRAIPDFEEKNFVTVMGEVRFPGVFGVKKDETLSSLIERAGGFKEDAYLKGAVFTRESVRRVQQERINKLIEDLEHRIAAQESGEIVGIIDPEDIRVQKEILTARRTLLEKLKTVRAKGRIVIHVEEPERFRGTDSDLILENNDALFVPKKMNVVNVVGEVFNPTAVTYNAKKKRAGHYLDLVGGPTDNADEKQIFLIKADGTVVSRKNVGNIRKAKMDPGDTLAVPEKIVKSKVMRELKDITQILYQIAVTAGVLIVAF